MIPILFRAARWLWMTLSVLALLDAPLMATSMHLIGDQGAPGEDVALTMLLVWTPGEEVVETVNELRVETRLARFDDPGCVIHPDISDDPVQNPECAQSPLPPSAPCKRLETTVVPDDEGHQRLRLAIGSPTNSNAIDPRAEDVMLYRCQLRIAASVPPGTLIPVRCEMAQRFDAAGIPFRTQCTSVQIFVDVPTPTATATPTRIDTPVPTSTTPTASGTTTPTRTRSRNDSDGCRIARPGEGQGGAYIVGLVALALARQCRRRSFAPRR